jgi:hypothetical protein
MFEAIHQLALPHSTWLERHSPVLPGINLPVILRSDHRLSQPVFQRRILYAKELLDAVTSDTLEGSQNGMVELDG